MTNYIGTAASETLVGDTGKDLLDGRAGNDVVHGGADNDIVYGGDGNDSLHGDDGSDALVGGAGDDILYADANDHTITGGAGIDTVMFTGADDIVTSANHVSAEIVMLGGGNDFFDVVLSSPIDASYNLGGIDGTNGFQLLGGHDTDEAGSSVSGVGDVNGDGLADFVIGAPGTLNHAGEAYLVFGRADGFVPTVDLGAASPLYARLTGVGQAVFNKAI